MVFEGSIVLAALVATADINDLINPNYFVNNFQKKNTNTKKKLSQKQNIS